MDRLDRQKPRDLPAHRGQRLAVLPRALPNVTIAIDLNGKNGLKRLTPEQRIIAFRSGVSSVFATLAAKAVGELVRLRG